MSLARLVQILDEGGFDVGADELLDSLWLAAQQRSLASAFPRGDGDLPVSTGPVAGAGDREPGDGTAEPGPPGPSPPPSGAGTDPEQGNSAGLLYAGGSPSAADRTITASPVATPGARALPNRLGLLRGLRPLRQRWPSRQASELDEEATAQLTADLNRPGENRLYPVFRPRLERWFECDLILEDDDAAEIWRDPLRGFAQVLRDSGAFREVRSWRLRLSPAAPQDLSRATLETPAGGCVPARRLSGGIRRLILFASHGSSGHWRTGSYARLLAEWSVQANVALLHLLPRDMWLRTALGEAQARGATSRPGAGGQSLEVETHWWMPAPDPELSDTLRLPVVELEPEVVAEWAAMQMARGRSAPLFLLDASAKRGLAAVPPDAHADERPITAPPDDRAMIERRIDALREAAPEALQLGVMLSVCPFTIPVAHLMQEAKFGTVDNRRLAELFLSGLIRSVPPTADMPRIGETWYSIVDGAKPLLLRSMRAEEASALSREIFERVSSHLATITGRSGFLTLTPDAEGKYRIPDWAQPFARMVTSLRALRPKAEEPVVGIAALTENLPPPLLRRLLGLALSNRPMGPEELGPEAWERLIASEMTREGPGGTRVFDEAWRAQLAEIAERSALLGFRILWADDSPSNNSSYVARFRQWGAEVYETPDTDQAITRLMSGPAIDLVISDMARPPEQHAGLQLLEHLRGLISEPPPLIIFAGWFAESQERRRQAVEAGAIACTNDGTELAALVLEVASGTMAGAPPLPADAPGVDVPVGGGEDDAHGDGDGDYHRFHEMGRKALEQGDLDVAQSWFERMRRAAEELDEEFHREAATSRLGDVALARGDLPAAKELYGLAMFHASRTEGGPGMPRAHLRLAEVAERMGDIETAEDQYREAAEGGRRHGSWDATELLALSGLGRLAGSRGDLEAAEELFTRVLTFARERGEAGEIQIACSSLAALAERRRDFDGARNWCREAARAARESGEHESSALARLELGRLEERLGNLRAADGEYVKAWESARETEDHALIASTLTALGTTALRFNNLDMADHRFQEALLSYAEARDQSGQATTILQLGKVAARQGDVGKAEEALRTALGIGERIGEEAVVAAASLELGGLLQSRRDWEQARESSRRALLAFERIGNKRGIADSHRALAVQFAGSGDADNVRTHLEMALPIFEELDDRKGILWVQGALDGLVKAPPGKTEAAPPDGPGPADFDKRLTVSHRGTKLIQQFEGCAKKQPDGTFAAYPDPGSGGDPWTIGWGSTGPDIKKGVVWTQKQCDDRFTSHLAEFADAVKKALGNAPTTQNQFDAMVSFAYNVGVPNLATSTLLKKHKAGDYKGAAAEFARWNKAAGKVMSGLTRRRAAEAELYAS